MDPIVDAALKKWPNVPACCGWLALDARGDWSMRDERTQAAGPFPRARGSRIEHAGLRGFIERNYAAEPDGRWFFQNGPQKVYVELEAAPWVWRLQEASDGALRVTSHSGLATVAGSAWLDEAGRLFLGTPLGLGLVHSMDMTLAADAVERGDWQPRETRFVELPARFGYRLSPAADAAAAAAAVTSPG